MGQEAPITKILFVDNDEMGFQFRKCMAQVLKNLPPVELFHANDATEALALMESLKPHVLVLDEECHEETELLIDSLPGNHPPIVLQTLEEQKKPSLDSDITRIEKNESLEGIHKTLMIASSVGSKGSQVVVEQPLH